MANPTTQMRMNDGRLRCADCGMPYASESWSDFVIPDEAWGRISPARGGVLCVQCMIDRANAAGVSCVGQFTSGPFADHKWVKSTERNASEIDAATPEGAQRAALLGEKVVSAAFSSAHIMVDCSYYGPHMISKGDDVLIHNVTKCGPLATHPPADAEDAALSGWEITREADPPFPNDVMIVRAPWGDQIELTRQDQPVLWEYFAAIDAARVENL